MVATVSAVSSASGATRYYERDGYYANDDPEHKKGSFWHGKVAEGGGDFTYIPCLNADAGGMEVIRKLVEENMGGWF